ncbi:MAG: ATP-binding protein, partial [Thermoleophilaceae bacterium]|nr:ATP-binding protein [Thermoleophilaceae bacterium]
NTVRRYVERARPGPAPASEERFETAPGHRAQVDWSHEEPLRTSSGLEVPLYCFHMVLGHSRDSFCAMTGSQDLVTFWACHQAAFRHFGGVPRELLYDRTKTVVRQHVGRERSRDERRFIPRRWPRRTTTASGSGCVDPTGPRPRARSSPTSPTCAGGCFATTASPATSRPTPPGGSGTRTSPAAGCTAPTARSWPCAPSATARRCCRCRRRPIWSSSGRPGWSPATGCSASRGVAARFRRPGPASASSSFSATARSRSTRPSTAAGWRATSAAARPGCCPTRPATRCRWRRCWARCPTRRCTAARFRSTKSRPVAELITERIRRHATELRLHGIAEDPDEPIERAEAERLGYREFLDLVLESEVGVLEGRRYQARLKMAGLPHHKTLDEFDVSFQPELDPKRLAELRTLRFVERKVGCLILGPPGVGKSHISVGLAMEALARGYLVRYTTLDDLVRGPRQADALSKLSNKPAQLQRPHLLIIDEAGYVPLEHADANRVFQVVNRRYTRGSTIVTSNKTVSEWADTFGDEALAAAILDRLLHDAEVLAINGPSYRLKGRLEALRQATDRPEPAE